MTVFVTDIDGTLMHLNKKLTKATVAEFNNLVKQGVKISVCTARGLNTAKDILEELDIRLPVGLMNGAVIYDIENQKTLKTYPIDDSVKQKLFSICDSLECQPFFFTVEGEGMYAYHHKPMNKIEVQLMMEGFEDSDQFEEKSKEEIIADTGDLIAMEAVGTEKDIDAIIDVVMDISGIEFIKYEDVYIPDLFHIEMVSELCDKGVAAKYIQDAAGADKLVTFGDNHSDVNMFKVSDLCYATENALVEVKEAATEVIGHCNDDSVVAKIKEMANI